MSRNGHGRKKDFTARQFRRRVTREIISKFRVSLISEGPHPDKQELRALANAACASAPITKVPPGKSVDDGMRRWSRLKNKTPVTPHGSRR